MNPARNILACLILVTTSVLVATPPAAASEALNQQEIEARLKALEEELSNYKDLLENTEGQKSEIEETLKRNEKGISDLIKEIEHIEEELGDNEDKVSRLADEQIELKRQKSEQQGYIAKQVRAAYEIGSQEYLKVLLNQEDPNEIARMLTYYDYFNEARADQIRQFNGTLAQLDRVSAELASETNLLNQNRSRLNGERQTLAATQREKRKTLATLIAQIRSTGSEITRIEKDREHLEKLLVHLETSLANLPAPEDSAPFAGMQGKLLMPVDGKVATRFGKHRNAGKLKWDGVFIEADEGEPVFAIHYGRVVFSDWLRGFGLLMIISHGEGYMSLYGHNQVLYRGTGDWVTAGDTIATVGDSGGQNQTGLYFEIRISGKPSDPQRWCVARDPRTA